MKKTIICAAITAAVVLISTAVICVRYAQGKGENCACVYSNDVLIRRINLDEVTKPYEFTVTSTSGGYNVVSVRKGAIGVTEASCPDGVCIHTGFIETSVLPVVCLPNKLVIKIESDESGEIDAAAQ